MINESSMVKWIVQKNLIKPDVLAQFRQAFEELGIDFEEVRVIPFSEELPSFKPSAINICYGSTTFMLNAYGSKEFEKGVFYHPERFTVQTYLDKWGTHMLNADGKILTFRHFVEKVVASKERWFLRPNQDDKSFAGTTMTSQEIQEWYGKILEIDNPKLNSGTLIFCSEEKKILKEWRNFVVDKQVVDASRYVLNGALHISREDVPSEMIQFVEARAQQFSPHSIFVMDVAETKSGYKIIECNCFNGTGFYRHHLRRIIQAVTDYTLRIA
ncbi:MAG: ATP-grasp domain-containing protein [Bacteroidota bacterium]